MQYIYIVLWCIVLKIFGREITITKKKGRKT